MMLAAIGRGVGAPGCCHAGGGCHDVGRLSCWPIVTSYGLYASRHGSQDSEHLIVSDKTTEPSSLVVLLRALVMLVFLVGLPGVAVLKGSFPQLADRLAERGREVLASVSDQISAARGTAIPPSGVSDPPTTVYATPPQIQSTVPPAQVRLDDHVPGRLENAADERTLASSILRPQPGMTAIDATVLGVDPVQPAAFDTPQATATVAGPATGEQWRQTTGPVVPLDPQRAEQLVGVLRQLGATYYRLEKWGDDDTLFRFQCKMSLDGNPHVNRHFEATDADANRAIAHVVKNVRQWLGVATQ
jgi:hypothetical protein